MAILPSGDDDELFGTPGDDLIDALGGHDTVHAGAGSDQVAGGAGHDELFGGDGHDHIGGGDGNDLLRGGTGNDELFGEAGSDELYGDAGNDMLDGGLGHDELDGGDGHDELYGAEGRDLLLGGLGNDVLFGGYDDDELAGGAGDDELRGGAGFDVAVFAGNRADYDIATAADGATTVRHRSNGADGADTLYEIEGLQFADDMIAPPPPSSTPGGMVFNLAADANGEYAVSGLGELRISTAFFAATAAYNNTFGYYVADASGKPIGGRVIETVARETAGDPMTTVDLAGYPGAVKLGFFIIPNGGNENPGLSDGTAVTFQKTGEDWAAYAGSTKLSGADADVFFSNAALNASGFDYLKNTALNGNQNWEDLKGGGDKDFDDLNVDVTVKAVLQPGQIGTVEIQDDTPADGVLTASAGNPLTANLQLLIDPAHIAEIRYQWQSSANGQNWTPIQGANRDRFAPRQSDIGLSLRVVLTYVLIDSAYQEINSYSHATPAVVAVAPVDTGPGQESDGPGDASSNPGQNGHHDTGGDGDTPNAGQSGGNDDGGNHAPQPPAHLLVINGTEGVNLLRGSSGGDLIQANGGTDSVHAGRGDDFVYGGEGNDVLFGGRGNDVIYGGGGDDRLFGDDGHDWLFGGEGSDKLYGGRGNDKLDGDAGSDVAYGGAGKDQIAGDEGADRLYGGASADTISGGDDNDALVGGSGADQLSGDSGDDSLDGGSGNDKLSGGTGSDCLAGGSGHDQLLAEAGNDALDGGRGNDLLVGGAGDDCLKGGQGNDTLYGGTGDDLFYGGAGRDTFFYYFGDGDDEILDFEENCDAVVVEADIASYTITATDYGRDYVFQDGGKLAVRSNSGKGSGNSGSDNSGRGSDRYEDFDDELDYEDFGRGRSGGDDDCDEWADLVAGGVIDAGYPTHTNIEGGYSPYEDMSIHSLLGVSMITFSHEDSNLFGV